MRNSRKPLGVALTALLLIVGLVAPAAANSGTIKVHSGTGPEDSANNPTPDCDFYAVAQGFDADTYTWTISENGGANPETIQQGTLTVESGEVNAPTEAFQLESGQYRLEFSKNKSKVFSVDCDEVGSILEEATPGHTLTPGACDEPDTLELHAEDGVEYEVAVDGGTTETVSYGTYTGTATVDVLAIATSEEYELTTSLDRKFDLGNGSCTPDPNPDLKLVPMCYDAYREAFVWDVINDSGASIDYRVVINGHGVQTEIGTLTAVSDRTSTAFITPDLSGADQTILQTQDGDGTWMQAGGSATKQPNREDCIETTDLIIFKTWYGEDGPIEVSGDLTAEVTISFPESDHDDIVVDVNHNETVEIPAGELYTVTETASPSGWERFDCPERSSGGQDFGDFNQFGEGGNGDYYGFKQVCNRETEDEPGGSTTTRLPEPEADISFSHEAECSTEDAYDLTLTFTNDGDGDGTVLVGDDEIEVPADETVIETLEGIVTPVGVNVRIGDDLQPVDDEGVDYDPCTSEVEGVIETDPGETPDETETETEDEVTPVQDTGRERAEAVSGQQLPETGSSPLLLVVLGLLSIGLGSVMLRRRTTEEAG